MRQVYRLWIHKREEHFRKMEDLYVVYLSEFDVFHRGYTKYHVDSVIRETGENSKRWSGENICKIQKLKMEQNYLN